MNFKKDDIIVVTNYYQNGRKSRIVGIIANIDDNMVAILHPLKEKEAKPIRDKYLEDFNHQGHLNPYDDRYGFASIKINRSNTTVKKIGHNNSKIPAIWNPAPGNPSYDLMS